jgi:hypothetical protein
MTLAATSDKRALGHGPLHGISKKVNDHIDTTSRRIAPEAYTPHCRHFETCSPGVFHTPVCT